jgi:hypothetical protein
LEQRNACSKALLTLFQTSLFLCFEAVSSLKINLAKSGLVPIGTVEDVEGLDRIHDCRVFFLPKKYLNLPFGGFF